LPLFSFSKHEKISW